MNLIPEAALRTLCTQIDGDYGFYLSVPESGEKLVIRPDKRMVSASTIKIPLLALLLKDGEDGRLNLDAPIQIAPANRVGGAGILQSLSASLAISLFDCAVLMMDLSDNIATNQVIDAVGMDRANAFFAEHGWTSTHLGRKMMTPGEQNYTSAADLANMMERILAGTLVSPTASATMMQIMAGQQGGKFRPALPAVKHPDPRKPIDLPPEGKVMLSAKAGTLASSCVANDAGIMLLPSGRSAVLAITTHTTSVSHAEHIMGQIARTVYEALK